MTMSRCGMARASHRVSSSGTLWLCALNQDSVTKPEACHLSYAGWPLALGICLCLPSSTGVWVQTAIICFLPGCWGFQFSSWCLPRKDSYPRMPSGSGRPLYSFPQPSHTICGYEASYTLLNTGTKSNLERKGFVFPFHHRRNWCRNSSRAGPWRQGLKQRS